LKEALKFLLFDKGPASSQTMQAVEVSPLVLDAMTELSISHAEQAKHIQWLVTRRPVTTDSGQS